MNRFITVIAATAAAAAVAAAISLPAGADDNSPKSDADFVSCLRSHGASIPADTQGVAIKTWLIAHKSDAGVESALNACSPDKNGPEELIACLRDHGLQPPSAVEALKPWVAAQLETDAGKAALKACGVDAQQRPGGGGPGPVQLAKCLHDHGVSGAPDGSDGVALKTWLGSHMDDPGVMDALKACDAAPGPDKATAGCGAGVPAPKDRAPAGPDPAKAPDAVTLQQ